MTRAMENQRAIRPPRRPRAGLADDEYIIGAVLQLFDRIEAALDQGAQTTPQAAAFLSDLSKSLAKHLKPGAEDMTARLRPDNDTPPPAGSPNTAGFDGKEVQYPEGGLRAWLVVFGSWCGLLSSIGLTNILAAFHAYISQHQLKHYDESTVGWIFSVYAFLAFFGGVYVGPIFDKYGPRWLVLSGSLLMVADMMMLGFCTEFWHFLVTFGCVGGLGTALLFTPCVAAIGHYFNHGRGNATGIAVSSGALGGIAFPYMFQSLFPRIGFAWTTRILGLIYLTLCIMANLLIKSRLPPVRDASAKPDFRIFRNPIFALTVAGVFLLEWALFIPLAYISSYASAQGFSDAASYQTLVMLNVGSLFGRILPGYIADRIGRYNANILVILLAITSVFVIWLPFGMNIVGLTVFTILFGFASGSNISLAPVCIGQLCRTENYGRYYATCFTIVSLGCLTGIPTAGAVIDASGGSYVGLIFLTGSCYVGGLVAFTSARVLAKGWDVTIRY